MERLKGKRLKGEKWKRCLTPALSFGEGRGEAFNAYFYALKEALLFSGDKPNETLIIP